MGEYFDVGKCKDDVVYTTHIALILEHNRLKQNLKTLRERGGARFCGFGSDWNAVCRKVSSLYTMLKANVDVLLAHLSSRQFAKRERQNICGLHN